MRIISFCLFLLIPLGIQAQAPEKGPVQIYTSRHLRYASTFGEVGTDITINGNIVSVSNRGEKFTYEQQLRATENGLSLTRVYQKYKLLGLFTRESSTTYKSPLLRFPPQLKTGISWNASTIEYNGNDSAQIQLTGTVAGEETVMTKAGNFRTYRVETIFSHPGGEQSRVIDWIAPETGIIRTKIYLSNDGLMGLVKKLLGYSEITFELIAR
jgi:hypothetical protein